MTKTHVVDALHVCEELEALCNAEAAFLTGNAPQGHEFAKEHARCLYQLLGGFGAEIVAKSGRSLATTYLRELSHIVPWQPEFMTGAEVLTADDIAVLRRWLELIRNSERPQREYTPDVIPKGLLCKVLDVDSSTLQRRVKADPGLIHPSHGKCDQNVRFDIEKLAGTKIYRQADRTAAIEQWNQAKAKAKEAKAKAKEAKTR